VVAGILRVWVELGAIVFWGGAIGVPWADLDLSITESNIEIFFVSWISLTDLLFSFILKNIQSNFAYYCNLDRYLENL
jgi:hypothetical protein